MKNDHFRKLIGTWKYNPPWDESDDCRSEYEISGSADNPIIKATDFYDGEEYIVSNIQWDGDVLEFETCMKSTGRRGLNRFTLESEGKINSEFTFTETDILTKIK